MCEDSQSNRAEACVGQPAHLLQVDGVKAETGVASGGKAQLHVSLVAMYAGQLLLQLVSDDHAHVLRSWAAHALDLHKLAGEALPATSKQPTLDE